MKFNRSLFKFWNYYINIFPNFGWVNHFPVHLCFTWQFCFMSLLVSYNLIESLNLYLKLYLHIFASGFFVNLCSFQQTKWRLNIFSHLSSLEFFQPCNVLCALSFYYICIIYYGLRSLSPQFNFDFRFSRFLDCLNKIIITIRFSQHL